MAGIDLQIKRIRSTPYKLLYAGARVIGIFDHNNYVSRANMDDNLKAIIEEHYIEEDGAPESSGAMEKGGVSKCVI